MSKTIKTLFPHANIKGNESEPRTGSFEIMLNGNLVYSKFKTSEFPTSNEIKDFLND